MNFGTYETPETRSEFEERFHYMHSIMKQGKLHVSAHVSMEGILKVRKLPNGRIDFLSVNEQARLNANTMYHIHNLKVTDGIHDDESTI
ncbi:TPA: AVAST type 1 anti-phage system protein Avs1c [Vibrio diabolicus]